MEIYLDNAATAPLTSDTKEFIYNMLDIYGNPSSVHSVGSNAKILIEDSRESVAKFIGTDADNIIFTSGGSASNTIAIKCIKDRRSAIYSPIMHKSALKAIEGLGQSSHIMKMKVDGQGRIDLDDLKYKLQFMSRPLVIVEYANSEIGTVQDIKEIAAITHNYGGLIYVDCTGAISQLPLKVDEWKIDICGFSAHKLGGLKGCGVLCCRPNVELSPFVYGSQENGIFGGTENVLGIATLGHVVENHKYLSIEKSYIRDEMINELLDIPDSILVGSMKNRLPGNLYVVFKDIDSGHLSVMLNEDGIYLSTGSACNSGDNVVSPTLNEIGILPEYLHGGIRLSFSGLETMDQIKWVASRIRFYVEVLRAYGKK